MIEGTIKEMCIRDRAIIGAVFANGYVKNKVMEFVGPGVAGLSADSVSYTHLDVYKRQRICKAILKELLLF